MEGRSREIRLDLGNPRGTISILSEEWPLEKTDLSSL